MAALRVGIIGAGVVAQRHAEAYSANVHAQVTAVADTVSARAADLAERYEAAAYESYEELIASGRVDAVSVCVPHNLLSEVAVKCANLGIHILIEKPMAISMREADEVVGATRRAGVTVMVGFVHRFRNEVLKAKELVATGALGAPATVLDRFCSSGGAHPPSWVWSRHEAGGGVLMYGGIHAVDRLMWLLDSRVTRVYASTKNFGKFGDVEDSVAAVLEFENGAAGALFENSPPYGSVGGWSTDVFGTQGALRIQTGEEVQVRTNAGRYTLRSEDDFHFHREINEFVEAILEGRAPSVPVEAGRRALRVALTVYDAAARGGPVQVVWPSGD